MSNSDFDPEAFINSAVSGSFDTQIASAPDGTYRGQVGDKIDVRSVQTKNGDTRYIMRLNWEVLDDTVRAELGRDRVFVSQDLWLDMDENGALDNSKGKNVDLGRVRQALGQNDDEEWSPAKLRGGEATIVVASRSDPNNPERKYTEVRRVAPLA